MKRLFLMMGMAATVAFFAASDASAQCCAVYSCEADPDCDSADPNDYRNQFDGYRCNPVPDQQLAVFGAGEPTEEAGRAFVAGCVEVPGAACLGGAVFDETGSLDENDPGLGGPEGCSCVAGNCQSDGTPAPDEGGPGSEGGIACTFASVKACVENGAAVQD